MTDDSGAALSFEQAAEAVTAPGGVFAITEAMVGDREYRVFANAPPTLRDLFEGLHGRDGIFLVYEDERWSCDDVVARTDAIAALLVDRYGVGPGDRVAIASRNYPEWVCAFGAVVSIGAIAVALNAWWTTEELEYGLSDSGATVVIADMERTERMAPLIDDLGLSVLVIRPNGDMPPGADRLDDVLVPGAAMPDQRPTPDDDATILYTSGTTGHPKGAVSTHRAITNALMAFGCRAAIVAARSLPGDEPDDDEGDERFPTCYILVVPLFHATGLIPVMLGCVTTGTRLVMMHKWDPERALELIERERVTVFVGVPTMSWDLLESPDFERRDTSSLVSVGGGGAPAPPELVRRIEDNFRRGRPSIGYGLTETNAYGPQNTGDDYLKRPRSTGRAVPILDVRIVDEEAQEVPVGEIGEICFRGPNVIRGYWGKPDATAEAIRDGWLHTGDLGRLDDEGYIYVEDRAKDMVIRAGENIYCAEVEGVLYEHPDVYEVAVFGLPHRRLGEELAAVVYPKPGRDLEPDDVRNHVAAHLAAFKVPTHVEIVGERLPRNASGKILKRTIRDDISARR